MKVKELIGKLKQFDGEKEVFFNNGSYEDSIDNVQESENLTVKGKSVIELF